MKKMCYNIFMKKIEFIANKEDRVLKLLEKNAPTVLYSAFVKALREKDVKLNGNRIKDNVVVPAGTHICAFVSDDSEKKNMFEIVYEDENVILVNKNKGIETSDGEYNVLDELIKQEKSAFAVHRLDRNTLGLVVFAKTAEAQKELVSQFKKGNVEKLYYAEVCGTPAQSHQILKGHLEKNKDESVVKIYNNAKPNTVPITTEYNVIKSSGNTSLLSVKIKDGKTHQIRAHLAFNKLYIIGDGKYGKNEINSKYKAKTQHLKSYKILFNIPNSSFLNYLNNLNIELDAKF